MSTSETTARAVVRETLSICRRRAPILAAIGIALFGPIASLEAVAAKSVHDGLVTGGGTELIAIGTYIAISLVLLGSAMCAGLLETLVGQEFGHVDLSLRQALRRLPYRRLVGVDLVQAVLVAVGSLVGIVPGILAFTATCLAGSLVMVENRGVGVGAPSIRRPDPPPLRAHPRSSSRCPSPWSTRCCTPSRPGSVCRSSRCGRCTPPPPSS